MSDAPSVEEKLARLEEIRGHLAKVNDLRRERDSLIVDLHGRTELHNLVRASGVGTARIFQILHKSN
ncbi:hypothetical protein [Corynebacterium sputi]|uniref:hypothetical protein n=1 Tax=Corynebacterium sputi TaxID=489915 RepID=UPI00040C247E|nr:hypothetical protein [Corynebacterium sputi]